MSEFILPPLTVFVFHGILGSQWWGFGICAGGCSRFNWRN
jgi:uncharacterized membrane protein YqaE (UPF0057 family)